MVLIFKNRFREFGFYFYTLLFIVLIFSAFFHLLIIKKPLFALFQFAFLLIAILLLYISSQIKIKKAAMLLASFLTLILYLNLLIYWKIFPLNYIWFVVLASGFWVNFSKVTSFLFCFILFMLCLSVPYVSSKIILLKNPVLIFTPTPIVLFINNVIEISFASIFMVIVYLFWLEKGKYGIKHWEDVITDQEELYDVKINLLGLPSVLFENNFINLYNEIIKIMELEKPYKNNQFCIEDLCDLLNANKKDLEKSLTNFKPECTFDEFINFHRIKAVKNHIDYT